MKILVVEDHPLLGKSIKTGFEEVGWVVDLAADGEEGLYCAESCEYDVIVLDWMLPKRSGIELLRELRAKHRDVPAIMITAKGAVADRVEGLDRGADDYLVKPFEMPELVARVNALFRRSIGRGTSSVSAGSLSIDFAAHRAALDGAPLELTGKEYDLLAALVAKQDQLIRRTALVGMLYQLEGEPESNSLDVLLARVRKKLAGSDIEIATVRGKGFILRVAPPST